MSITPFRRYGNCAEVAKTKEAATESNIRHRYHPKRHFNCRLNVFSNKLPSRIRDGRLSTRWATLYRQDFAVRLMSARLAARHIQSKHTALNDLELFPQGRRVPADTLKQRRRHIAYFRTERIWPTSAFIFIHWTFNISKWNNQGPIYKESYDLS